MPVEIGSRLGAYEIVARLGAGGMGEVYRARDSRLGRDVAIKLLPDEFARDPERLARFEREAKLLASLQHSHIAVLHGLEESGGRRFLVMQCIEGESLAQRLERGAPPLPEVLEIAGAIAAALEAAHESGIVHRDLKPGNVMVTPAGDVKVLDFGLARSGAGASGSATDAGLSSSPTRTYAATNAGVILGTAAYMSPEQARGKPVDRRTDIWSFGCVLFELLTGQQAFGGETTSDIVARILQTEPDWSLLPAATPGRLRDLLVRCLQKDARRRLRDIGDARVEIEDLIAGRVSASGAHLTPTTTAARRPWLVPLLAALVVVAAAAGWFAARSLAPAGGGPPARFVIDAPRDQVLGNDAASAQLSPDGRMIAMIASDSSGTPRVWIRRLDSLAPKALPGTEHATVLFWSPDSRYLAFFANDRQLSKVAVAGGEPEPICDARAGRGGSWNRDGVIVFAPTSNGAVYRVSASGGDPVVVVRPDSAHGETGLRFPLFLPDGRHFLYSSLPVDSTGRGRVCVASLDGAAPRVLLRAECGVVYADPGWLLYTRNGQLVAQRFDAGSLALKGDPIPLGDLASGSQYGGAPLVSVARTGALAFGSFDPVPNRLAWFDLQGHETAAVPGVQGFYFHPELSPDEHHALVVGFDAAQGNYLSLVDLDRGVVSHLTPPEASPTQMAWAPDGHRFACIEQGRRNQLVVYSLLDDSREVFLTNDFSFKRLDGWSRDGRFIVYERLDPTTKWDIEVLPMDGSGPAHPLIHSPANDEHAALSQDGRWLAYQSDESGVSEVYVTPFDRPGMRYQVTSGGGQVGGWTWDGKRFLYLESKRPTALLAADIRAGADFTLGPARLLGRLPDDLAGADMDHAGQRILALVPAERARPQSLTVLQNWRAALRKP